MAQTQRRRQTLESITIECMLQLLKDLGFEAHPLCISDTTIEHPPWVRWERHEVYTIMQLLDDVDGDRRYRTVRFSAEMPIDGTLWDFWYNDRDSLPRDTPKIRMERRFTLAHGVSRRWLTQQVKRWDCDVFLQRVDVQSRCAAPFEEVVH